MGTCLSVERLKGYMVREMLGTPALVTPLVCWLHEHLSKQSMCILLFSGAWSSQISNFVYCID